ncbi:NADH-quinone oxidoreductase subunit B [Raoultella planticola]|uniref:NADH-quinone oxidoreductase subunit B n=2 Tax=Klebsiella/Raoultella group TaxID=2890311 RepID=A0A485C7L6_RAOPL|nr:NADH-quinone oxidoreductase subunit B [Raoultella planticola]
MDYTLTRIDPNGENDRYPLQKQEIVTDPLEQEVNKSVYMGKLEHALHDMVNWGPQELNLALQLRPVMLLR